MPTRTQTLILWAILVAPDDGLVQKDVRPAVTTPDRDALIKASLLAAALDYKGERMSFLRMAR